MQAACAALIAGALPAAHATLLTDKNDARSWQGANVGTFAQLYHGNTDATRQQVIDDSLLDDGNFDSTGYVSGQSIRFNSNT